VVLCPDRVLPVAMVMPWVSVGWMSGVSARWGRVRGPAGVAIAHWGLAWSSRRERERGVLAGFGLGLPFLPSIQPDTTRVDLWQDFVLGFEKICW
jgi:hypothetical protein